MDNLWDMSALTPDNCQLHVRESLAVYWRHSYLVQLKGETKVTQLDVRESLTMSFISRSLGTKRNDSKSETKPTCEPSLYSLSSLPHRIFYLNFVVVNLTSTSKAGWQLYTYKCWRFKAILDTPICPSQSSRFNHPNVLYCIDGVVIAAQCTATFLRFIVLPRI